MEKAGHLFLGIILGGILILLTHYYLEWFDFADLKNIGLVCVIIYVYSLFSDIDTRASTIVWTFLGLGIIFSFAGYALGEKMYLLGGLGLITITFLAAQVFPHRGFTHSILFGLFVSIPWIYLSYEYSILAFVCFYSHMLGDEEYFKLI